MFIAIVDFATAVVAHSATLAYLDTEGDQVQAVPGNLAFRVYPWREEEGWITLVHEWDNEMAFQEYLRSASFARSGQVLRPLMVEAPVRRRFRAELLETVA